MSVNYNRLYNIKIKDETNIPATAPYITGNVCLLAPQKAQMAGVVASSLAIGKDISLNALDVSGNSYFTGRVDVSGNLYINGAQVGAGIPTDVSANFVWKTNNVNESINGIKTFVSPPECSTAPTTANMLTNKSYTDGAYVYKTGAVSEVITGVKTFNGRVICSNANVGQGGTDLITKNYGDGRYIQLNGTNTVEAQSTWNEVNTFNAYANIQGIIYQHNSTSDNLKMTDITTNAGTSNYLIGKGSGNAITTGTNNLAYGLNTLNKITTHSNNTCVGQQAGLNLVAGNNTILGYQAQQGSSTFTAGTDNVSIGYFANRLGGSAGKNVVIGAGACKNGLLNSNRDENVFIGYECGGNMTNNANIVRRNVCIGSNNTRTIGNWAGGEGNTILGWNSANNASYCSGAVVVGQNIANNIGTGTLAGCVLIGNNAGQNATQLNETIIIGGAAGGGNKGVYNTYLGTYAGSFAINTNNYNCNFFGFRTDLNVSNATYQNVTVLGSRCYVNRSNAIYIGHWGNNTGSNANLFLQEKVGVMTNSAITTAGATTMTTPDFNVANSEYGEHILLGSAVTSITLPTGNGRSPTGVVNTSATSICAMPGTRYTFIKNYNAPYNSITINAPANQKIRTNDGDVSSYTFDAQSSFVSFVCVDWQPTTNPTGWVSWALMSEDPNKIYTRSMDFANQRNYFGANGQLVIDSSSNIFLGNNQSTSQAGSANTAVGTEAFSSVATSLATNNTAIGYRALQNITDGRENAGYGYQAGSAITTGIQNTLVGFNSGYVITTGSNNTAVGNDTFNILNTGNNNTAVGRQAGGNTKTSTKCSFFGYNTSQDISNNTYDRGTAIGADAVITASNAIFMGTSSDSVRVLGTLQTTNAYLNTAQNSYITTSTTLAYPLYPIYAISLNLADITVTMPEITSASQLGIRVTFRLVEDADDTNGNVVKIARSGTSNKIMLGSLTQYTTAQNILGVTLSQFFVTVMSCKVGGNYGWVQV